MVDAGERAKVYSTMDARFEVYGQEPNVFPWSYGSSTTWYFTREGTAAPHPPGVGYQGSLAHAPNEHIRLEDARRAMKATAGMLMAL